MESFGDYSRLLYCGALVVLTACVYPYVSSGRDGRQKKIPSWVRICYWAGLVFYVLFASFREIGYGYGGTDAYGYKMLFEAAQGVPFLEYIFHTTSFEIGYSTLSWVVEHLFHSYAAMLCVVHGFTYALLARFMRDNYVRVPGLAASVLATNILLLEEFNTLRTVAALSIALNCIAYAVKERYLSAALVVILASSFHLSALIFLPAILLSAILGMRKEFHAGLFVVLGGGALLVAFLGVNVLGAILTNMGKGVYTEEGAIAYGVYLPALVLLLLLLARGVRAGLDGRYAVWYVSAFVVCLCCWPLQSRMAIVYRMAMNFIPIIYTVSLSGQINSQIGRNSISNLVFKFMALCYPVYRIVSFVVDGMFYCGNYNIIF